MRIVRLDELPTDRLADLVAESEAAGLRFVRRLIEEWDAGVNRFNKLGEALFAAVADERVIGVCGLNIDPYTGDPRTGRVRRLYVLAAFRRRGVGGRLLEAVIAAARGVFGSLRTRAKPDAARLVGRFGFVKCGGVPDCTHVLTLPHDPPLAAGYIG